MHSHDLRIIFMGTPEFAAHCLKQLHEQGYNIVAVVTMPDKPAGRGHKVQYSAVKDYALSVDLPLLQPERLKDEGFLEELRSFHADLQIVVAFRMLPEVVWSMPPLGTFNLHASLLPQYRGAAPINWAIINGETKTGVTTFYLKHDIDTGDILMQEELSVGEDEDAGSLHDRMMVVGARLIASTVEMIASGNITPIPQTETENEALHPAPKIFKETCLINFNQSVNQVHNFVRGLAPYPAAWCELELGGQKIVAKIFRTLPHQGAHTCGLAAGSVIVDGKRSMSIVCQDGVVDILEMQLPGKRRMGIKDILNGIH